MKPRTDPSTVEAGLKRSITFPQLLLYGLGTMVGGGFYALTGKMAGMAGLATPLAFLVAGILAAINAFTFAELSARHPWSAGEARYVQEGLRHDGLAQLTGWMVIATGVVSAGTLTVATVGFLRDVTAIPEAPAIALLVVAMGLVAAWGVGQSVTVVMIITIIEIGALLFILVIAGHHLETVPERWPEILPVYSAGAWIGILSAAFLGFYAFIGFEDMVNMAEEVRDVQRTLPKAILWSVAIATTLYVIVSLTAVMAIDPEALANARTPMAAVAGGTEGRAGKFLFGVSLLTGVNGALVQIIMASRVAYGMAKRSQAPAWLAAVNPRTRTPLKATALMTGIILALALFFPMTLLAQVTSAIMLIIFTLLNVSLWRMKRRKDPLPDGAPDYSILVPALGGTACLAILIFKLITILGVG